MWSLSGKRSLYTRSTRRQKAPRALPGLVWPRSPKLGGAAVCALAPGPRPTHPAAAARKSGLGSGRSGIRKWPRDAPRRRWRASRPWERPRRACGETHVRAGVSGAPGPAEEPPPPPAPRAPPGHPRSQLQGLGQDAPGRCHPEGSQFPERSRGRTAGAPGRAVPAPFPARPPADARARVAPSHHRWRPWPCSTTE